MNKEIQLKPIHRVALGAAILGATLTGGAFGAAFLGGSANAQDFQSLLDRDIDGLLVGGASLHSDFIEMIQYEKSKR